MEISPGISYIFFQSCRQWRHQKFFCGVGWGIEGAKCDSEGAKIQKFAENG